MKAITSLTRWSTKSLNTFVFADEVVTNGVITELLKQLNQLNDTVHTVDSRVNAVDNRVNMVEQKFEGKVKVICHISQYTEMVFHLCSPLPRLHAT